MSWRDTIEVTEDAPIEAKTSWRDTISEAPKSSWRDTISEQDTTSKLESAVAGIASGGTFGFADELKGAIRAGGETLGIFDDSSSVFDEGILDKIKTRYQTGRDKYRQYEKELEEANPGYFMGGQIAGGIASGVATGGVGPKSILAKAALEGATYGLGASEADLTEGDLQGALEDTAKGAAVGAAIPVAGKVIKGTGGVFNKGLKSLAGVSGKNAEKNMLEGASNILGIPAKKLDTKMVETLKEAGLGWKSQRKIIEELNKKADDLVPVSMDKLADFQRYNKAIDFMRNKVDDYGLGKEAMRMGKQIDPLDVVSFGAGGIPGYVSKKGRDILANRLKLKSEDVSKNIAKITDPTRLLNIAGKETGDKVRQLTSSSAFRVPYTQQMINGTKYERAFTGDPDKDRVSHYLLMKSDEEYRNLINNNEEK
jgi:hypothetical protein